MKWGGVGACVVLAVVYVTSIWWLAFWQARSGFFVTLSGGRVVVGKASPQPKATARFERYSPAVWWWFQVGWPPATPAVFVPLWAPLAGAAGLTGLAWWRARPAASGRCAECRYDLTGTPVAAVCPECGAGTAGGVGRG